MLLNEIHPNVPNVTHPVYWYRDKTVAENLSTINRWIGYYTPKLPSGCVIDEAAIMVPGPWHVRLLDADLRGAGWEGFNQASDLVFTNPFGTRYLVEYAFYRHSEVAYRLEVMHLPAGSFNSDESVGFSPLHASLWVPTGQPRLGLNDNGHWPIPHLSFKPGPLWNVEGGAERVGAGRAYGLAVQHLKGQGCIHAQSCQSTYGQFGYYVGNDASRSIYIKPRRNMRDEG
jgi:hypothetical protein